MKYLNQLMVLTFLFFPFYLIGQVKDTIVVENNVKSVDSIKQNLIIGIITNNEGIPLSEVIVINKTDYNSVLTNQEGNYAIHAVKGDTLSYLLFEYYSKEIQVKNEKVIDVILEEFDDVIIYEPDQIIEEKEILEAYDMETETVVEMALMVAAPEEEDLENINLPCLNAKRLVGKKRYDSRFERSDLDSSVKWQSSILEKTESVAVIMEKEKLFKYSLDSYQLDTSSSLGEIYNLCDNQIFKNQPVVGTGTGFIVGENSMLTAKHVFERPIEDYVVVFGYDISNGDGQIQSKIPKSNVFYPKSFEYVNEELDVVQFTVDREFKRPILEWENSRSIDYKTEIFMIGHPAGLPIKIALNANIEDNAPFQYFYTSLDGFQGNSGSPIFNLCTNKVIGILVSGQLDYEFNGICYETTLCKFPYCQGEKVIRIEQILNN